MPKYRKKPVVIDAIQLTELNIKQIYEMVHEKEVDTTSSHQATIRWEQYRGVVAKHGMKIPTLEDGKKGEAKHVASLGDFIITGIKGEHYPCKPDIFELTYEKVEE